MRGIHRIQLLGLIVAVFIGFGATNASALTIKAEPNGYTFIGAPFVQAPGESAFFENPIESDFIAHNVTSDAAGPDGFALFESATVQGGKTSPIAGAEYLAAGTYPFVCTLHSGMSGDLLVEGAGTPVPRPSVALSIPAQRLKQVKRTGKVKVRVRAVTTSKGVVVNLLKGKARVSAPVRLNLKGGTSRIIAVKLNAAGKRAVKRVKKGKKLALAATSSVRYGKKNRANRVLR